MCKWLCGNCEKLSRMWRNGRRRGLKIPWPQGRVGSSPTIRTNRFQDRVGTNPQHRGLDFFTRNAQAQWVRMLPQAQRNPGH